MNHEILSIIVPGGELKFKDGSRLIAEVEVDTTAISEVDDHESRHGVAAIMGGTGLVEVSSKPGPGSRGHAIFDRPDPAAAAAPEAFGCPGTGYDMWTIRAQGISESSAISGGRARLAGKERHVKAGAQLLAKEGTVSGARFEQAVREVDEGDKVTVREINPEGKEVGRIEKRAKGKEIFIKRDELSLIPKGGYQMEPAKAA